MNKFLLINKPKGLSSFDVIRQLKKKYNHSNFGHTGTLDPLASGLLVIANGKEALKAIRFVNAQDKEYIATMQLGIKTNTGDITGNIIKTKEIKVFNIKKTFHSFIGKYNQLPPVYSAKKVNGKKAYEYSREGKSIKLEPVEVEIKEIKLLSHEGDKITFRILVTKGTYIRTLCEDIAQTSENLATMISLKRTKVGKFSLEFASDVKEIKERSLFGIIDTITLQQIKINDQQVKKLKMGQRFFLKEKGILALVYDDKLISVVENNDKMKIIRNFNEDN